MSQPSKEVQPPSYEEAMFASTEAPQVGKGELSNYRKYIII